MRLSSIAVAAAAGAGLTYFLDPDAGARRRNMARDRLMATLRSGGKKAESTAAQVSSQAQGAAARAAAAVRKEKPPPNDQALAAKVETVIFRDDSVPKGAINVDAADGVVTLRGEVGDRDMIEELEKEVRGINGVKDVSNLLHPPGTPAPSAS